MGEVVFSADALLFVQWCLKSDGDNVIVCVYCFLVSLLGTPFLDCYISLNNNWSWLLMLFLLIINSNWSWPLSSAFSLTNIHCNDVIICISFRGSTREAALVKLVDAFESFMLHGLVENKYVISSIISLKFRSVSCSFFGYYLEIIL